MKLRSHSLYYLVILVVVGILAGWINYHFKIKTNLVQPELLSLVPLMPAIFTFTPQFISPSEKTKKRIEWLDKQPGMIQFYYTFAMQGVIILSLYILGSIFSNDLSLSITYGLLISFFVFNVVVLLKFLKLFRS